MRSKLRNLLPVYLVVFFGFCGYSLLITIFTPLIIHDHGLFLSPNATLAHKVVILGVLLFLYPAGQFISSPVLGALSDRYGRKNIFVVTLICATIFYALLSLGIMQHSLLIIFLALILTGLVEGNIALTSGAISDLTGIEERQKYFGYIGFFASMAYIIGPLLGGKLAHWFSMSTPFWVVTVMLLVTCFLVIFWFRDPKHVERDHSISWLASFSSIGSIFTDKGLRKFFLISFLLSIAIFGFFRSYPMYLVDKFHMSVSLESEIIAWVSVPIIITALFLTGWLAKRFSARKIVMTSGFLLFVSLCATTLPNSLGPLWLILFVSGLGAGLGMPALTAMLSFEVSQQKQGRILGSNQSLKVAAEALSGLGAGFLAAMSIALPMLVLGILALLAALLCLTVRQRVE